MTRASSTPLAELCCPVLLPSVVPSEELMDCAVESFFILILKKEVFHLLGCRAKRDVLFRLFFPFSKTFTIRFSGINNKYLKKESKSATSRFSEHPLCAMCLSV